MEGGVSRCHCGLATVGDIWTLSDAENGRAGVGYGILNRQPKTHGYEPTRLNASEKGAKSVLVLSDTLARSIRR